MYKTVSATRQGKYFKLIISLVIVSVLTISLWKNYYKFEGVILIGLTYSAILGFFTILGLTFLNLFCEVEKWTTLMGFSKLSRLRALQAVLIGMCAGFLTPNRFGEFAGRAVGLPKPYRVKGSVMTFVGSGLQSMVTLSAGAVGLLFYPVFPILPEIAWFTPRMGVLFVASLLVFVLLVFYKNRITGTLKSWFNQVKTIPLQVISKSFFWAVVRYMVFSTQFVIALYCTGFSGSVYTAYAGVFLLYFIQTYIPFTAMGELGVREILAILIFGPFMEVSLLAAFASFMVWMANVGIPVAIGAIYIKFFKVNAKVDG